MRVYGYFRFIITAYVRDKFAISLFSLMPIEFEVPSSTACSYGTCAIGTVRSITFLVG